MWHPTGEPARREFYRADLKHDSVKAWYPSGNRRAAGYFVMGTGEERAYDSTGTLLSLSRYVDGKLSGKQESYYASGQVSGEIVYRSGEKISLRNWYPAEGGKRQLAETGSFKNGKKHGSWRKYTRDGVLVEDLNYVNGELHGESRYFDPETGRLQRSQIYERGMVKTARVLVDE